ncbi:MAG: DNA polymerase III subunit gamma/tau [Candidatus Omnitrophica bacterium]|nr:DNA polymerase III subunit gamma/tau [Candidatus Omnitrophota bacterium]
MAYQVFALKWRPQNFDQVVGQGHVVGLLKNSISKQRLAYAYLFAGPRGVGKTSTARILAKSLNCTTGPTINPCQACSPCQGITQCRSLDVLEIDGASNRGIDEIRALRESVGFAPSGGRFKIYIIDEVHMLTNEAFNALLKTLEEPPKFVKFIFATTQVSRIPATILSRCQRLDFRRISVLDIINQLRKITAQEKINLEEEVIFTIARACDGSLRDAESILDQLASFTKDKISISDVASLLGVLDQEILFEITDKIIKKDAWGALNLLDAMLRQGKDNRIILNNIIEHFRNLMVAKISQADSYLIDLPSEIIKRLFAQSQYFSLEEIFTIFNLLVNTQEMSKKMDSSIIPLEINLIRLTQEKKTNTSVTTEGSASPKTKTNTTVPTPEEKSAVVAEVEPRIQQNDQQQEELTDNKKLDSEKKHLHPAKEEKPPDQTELPDEIKDNWSKIIDQLSKVKMSVATFLTEGVPLKLKSGTLTISFPKSCSLHKETLEKKENRLLIEKALSQLLKTNVKVKFVLSLSEPAKEEAKQRNESDSFIHSAMNAFNARLI